MVETVSITRTVDVGSLRAWLMEQAVDMAASRGLGIAGSCLQLLRFELRNSDSDPLTAKGVRLLRLLQSGSFILAVVLAASAVAMAAG